ncbi:hypothetical protein QTP88_004329 [Uroleucon formosanum]
MLKTKTELLAEGLKIEDFKCSASWILSFRQRHSVDFGKMADYSQAEKLLVSHQTEKLKLNPSGNLDISLGLNPMNNETIAHTISKNYRLI